MSFYRFSNNTGIRFQSGGVYAITFPDGSVVTPPLGELPRGLWAGLGGGADWDRDLLPINVMYLSRPWTGNTSSGWGTGTASIREVLDENGYVRALPSGVTEVVTFFLNAQIDPTGETINGRYKFTYAGEGTISISGSAISNVDETSPGVIEFTYTANGEEGSSFLTISSITEGNHPRDMKMFQTRYESRMLEGYFTRPDFEWKSAKVLRFMDLQQTNNHHNLGHSGVGTWAKPGYFTWNEKGISFEHICLIANELGINPWVCIPHTADDAYVEYMASIFKENLDSDLRLFVEWSNETWNFSFQQSHYCMAAAVQAFGPVGGEGDGWYQYSGMRSAQCMDIFSEVFGSESSRLVRTAGMFLTWEGLQEGFLDAPLSVQLGNKAPYLSFDAYAISGYFGNALTDDFHRPQILSAYGSGGLQSAHEYMYDFLVTSEGDGSLEDMYNKWQYHKNVCTQRDLKLVMYEGGQHIVALGEHENSDTLTEILTTFNYSTQMADIYQRILEEWETVGDGGFNHFITIGRPSKYGSWGAMRWPKDLNPRAIVLLEYAGEEIVDPVDPPDPIDPVFRAPHNATTRTIHSGHSLTDAYTMGNWPGNMSSLRNSLFDPDDWDGVYHMKSTIPGSPIRWRWDNAAIPKDARHDIGEYDVLMITEAGPPPRSINPWLSEHLDYLCRFAANTIENGAGNEVILWSIWPALNGPGTSPEQPVPSGDWAGFTFRTGLDEYRKNFRYLADYTTWKMKQVYPELPEDWRVWLIPGNDWMARVYDDIQLGLVPGIEDISEFFSDDIHPTNDVANYGLACFVTTCLYQIDLRTRSNVYVDPNVSSELRDYFWTIAWEIANSQESVGLGGTENSSPVWTPAMGDPLPGWTLEGRT